MWRQSRGSGQHSSIRHGSDIGDQKSTEMTLDEQKRSFAAMVAKMETTLFKKGNDYANSDRLMILEDKNGAK